MSGPFDQDFNYGTADEYKQQFGSFDAASENNFTPVSGPPAAFDGAGFWYHPEPQDVYYHHHTASSAQVSSASSEQNTSVKHRRTRSGCFTCRSRRVKCDETRPICDRCRKGNRECVFPQASSASKRIKEDVSAEHGHISPQAQGLNRSATGGTALDAIHDVSDDAEESSAFTQHMLSKTISGSSTHSESKARKQKHRQQKPQMQASESAKDQSPTPSDAGSFNSRDHSSPEYTKSHATATDKVPPRWAKLKPAEQELLQFQRDHMTSYHYLLRLDTSDFVHDTLINMALSFDPLLSAVLAFAAYHKQMRSPHGNFKQFWEYYCRSIVQLRKWLEEKGGHSEAAVLTIMQLAIFEEYLGDWANVISHHRAAYSLLVSIYTPDSITATVTSRNIYDWFTRAEILGSLMANIETIMDRQWLLSMLAWSQARYESDSMDPERALAYFHSSARLLSFDMACTFAGQSATGSFEQDVTLIATRLNEFHTELQKLHQAAEAAEALAGRQSRDPEDLVPETFDSRTPLFRKDLWFLNLIWLDWNGCQQMHLYQTAKFLHAQDALTPSATLGPPLPSMIGDLPEQLSQMSVLQCQIYEAIERLPSAPAGAILGGHVSMAFSTIFLRRDPQHILWGRRKLATVEQLGYNWPATFRRSIAQLWGNEEIVNWWLPDNEGKPALVDEIRTIVEDRYRENVEKGIDDGKDAVRDLKAIFDNMGLAIPTSLKGGVVAASAGIGARGSGNESGEAYPTFGALEIESTTDTDRET